MSNIYTIAIVGRPNVGKSALFNKLVRKKKAIVRDEPGVTRDYKVATANLSGLKFDLVDTAGLIQDRHDGDLEKSIFKQTEQAIRYADHLIFVLDYKAGVTPQDQVFAKFLRKKHKSITVVVNKAENYKESKSDIEFTKLGFGEVLFISVEHNIGFMNLYEAISSQMGEVHQDEEKQKYINLAIIGRPNAGKSTLINTLLNKQRVLTGETAGITRDTIDIEWQYKGKFIKLYDTAGIKKQSKITKALDVQIFKEAQTAIRFSNVVVLLLDATCPLEKQDIAIARMAYKEGRAIVLGINKIDLIKDKQAFGRDLEERITRSLPEINNIPSIYISALKKNNIDDLIDKCLEVLKNWNLKISTSKLNQWLQYTVDAHPIPLTKAKKVVRIKYIVQAKTRPPTFSLYTNYPDSIIDSYKRYLSNSLKEHFQFEGTPIRMIFKKGNNPYVKN
jgi:GTPase